MRLSCLVFCAAWLVAAPAGAQTADGLRSFYARVHENFGDDIVSVEPSGSDVRVRVIRVALADERCPAQLVEAVERILPETTVQAVAGVRICDISNRRVARALAAAPSPYSLIDFIGSIDITVAACPTGERVFVFRMPPLVNTDKLRRQAPDVEALWEVGRKVRTLATPRVGREPFGDESPGARTAREAFGTSLLPELRSGRYDAAFPDHYFATLLDGYAAPPEQRGPLPLELVERDSLDLITYVAPVMPPIAVSARVFGDVRLRLTVNPDTGVVSGVQTLSGSPLHTDAAVNAARQWRFAPATAREPIEVTLRFEERCSPR